MDTEKRCGFSVCSCKVRPGSCYCSDDCEQAASQGVDRDFCQCSHACLGCADTTRAQNALSDAIHASTGRVVIEYASMYDLVDQLTILAKALDEDNYRLLQSKITPIERRPASSETASWAATSKMA